MSVDYSTCVGFGYVLNATEYDYIIDHAGDRLDDVESNITIIDAYRENTTYFLGTVLAHLEPGEARCINDILTHIDTDKFSAFYAQLFDDCEVNVFADTVWATPRLYILHTVT